MQALFLSSEHFCCIHGGVSVHELEKRAGLLNHVFASSEDFKFYFS